MSIAGDLDIEKTIALIEAYFGPIPRGTGDIPTVEDAEPPLTQEIRDTVYDNIQLPAVVQAYRIPPNGTDDYYAVSMLAQLMSQEKVQDCKRNASMRPNPRCLLVRFHLAWNIQV